MQTRAGKWTAGLVVMALAALVGRPAVEAADPGVPYDLGYCSRVVQRACPDCDEEEAFLAGSFSLAPGPARGEYGEDRTFVVDELVLRSEDIEARGTGVLVVHDRHVSFLGKLDMGNGDALVGGNGSADGPFPAAVHLPHVMVGGVRFEIYATPVSAPDRDCDGVTDADDICPGTACGAPANTRGCAIEQLCPCTASAGGEPWGSHRQYVRCVIGVSRSLLAAGKLDPRERETLVKSAVRSLCGRSAFAALGGVVSLP